MDDVVTLDVREDLRRGEEPLEKILATVERLRPGESLRLRTTFEPIPLFRVMERRGFTHEARQIAPGDWEVLFRPMAAAAPHGEGAAGPAPRKAQDAEGGTRPAHTDGGGADGAGGAWPSPAAHLDNRGLPPPEPMIRVLESLETLAPGEVLEVLNDREPVFLYPELAARGYAVRTERLAEGVRLHIRKGGSG